MRHKKPNGLTLIEVLVAINLSFFVLTLAVSFYLFAAKFISSFNNKYEKNEAAYNYISRLDAVLRKSGGFKIVFIPTFQGLFSSVKASLPGITKYK